MFKHAVILLICAFALCLYGSEDIWQTPDCRLLSQAEFFKNSAAVTQTKYPDANEVLMDAMTSIRYEKDGRFIQIYDQAVKIMNEKGRDDNRILTSYYTTSYSRAKIAVVEIIRPDGKVIPVDLERNTKEMIDSSQMSSNIYDSNSRLIQVSVPELAVGDILRSIFVDETFRPRIPGVFSDYIMLEGSSPILHSRIVIDAPSEHPLNSIAVKDKQGPGPIFTLDEKDGRTIYSWEVNSVPQVFPEPNMPPMSQCCQRLLVSTAREWSELSKWYYNLCEPRLVPNAELKNEVQRLIEGCTDIDSKIQALYTYVAQEIRYMGTIAEETAPGYEPHDVNKTFADKAGVCRDKAALLVAMLRAAGIEATPVLIHVGALRDKEVPMSVFNHAITAARHPETGRIILMDATDDSSRELLPAYLSEKSYLLATKDGAQLDTTPVTPYTDNMVYIQNDGDLSGEGDVILGTSMEFSGINDNLYRSTLLQMSPEERHNVFERIVSKSNPNAKLVSLKIVPEDLQDLSQPLCVTLSCIMPGKLIGTLNKKGGIDIQKNQPMLLQMPSFTSQIGLINLLFKNATLEKRRFDYRTNYTCGISENTTLRMPKGFEAISLPNNPHVNGKDIYWSSRYTAARGRVNASTLFTCQSVSLSPSEYHILRKTNSEIADSTRRRVIIQYSKKQNDDADNEDQAVSDSGAEILDLSRSIRIDSRFEYTSVLKMKVRITSHKGIGEWSDQVFRFNPSHESFSITDARVTNDHTTILVKDDMIHLMDMPYSASSPRYPAEKQLAITFPNVTVGSILEYTMTRKCQKLSFIGLQYPLQFHVPIQNARYEFLVADQLGIVPEFHSRGLLNLSLGKIRYGLDSDEEVDKETKMTKYTWECTNMPALPNEPNQPPLEWFCPTITITCGSWKDYAQDFQKVFGDLKLDAPEIIKLAKQLKSDTSAGGDMDCAIAIRKWLCDNIRTVQPSFNVLPMTAISAPATTLKDGYGNSLDCGILYYALLKACGLEKVKLFLASELALPDAQHLIKSFPSSDDFTKCIVHVKINGEDVWLNDQGKYAQFGTCAFDNGVLLDLDKGSLLQLSIDDDLSDMKQETQSIELQSNGTAKIEITSHIQGVEFGEKRQFYAQQTPEERSRHYQAILTELSPSAKPVSRDLHTDFIHYPGQRSFTAAIPNYAIIDQPFFHFTLSCPLPAEFSMASLDKRSTPLYWRNRTVQSTVFHLNVNSDFPRTIFQPSDYYWRGFESSFVYWHCQRLDSKAGAPQQFDVTLNVDLRPAILTPRQYNNLKEMLRHFTHPANFTFLMKGNTDDDTENP